jgi:LuxR family transcriptional regulator, maltose regulon positive regulatory protein
VQYLTGRLLGALPPELRRLLLRLSVTGELHPELVDRLAGPDGRRLLTVLARGNRVVEAAPGAPGGVRIHPLIRDLLGVQLRFERPGTATALHWMCAAWYADTGQHAATVATGAGR